METLPVAIPLALVRPFARLGYRAGLAVGRLLLRLARLGAFALLAGLVIFLLDMLLVRDAVRPEGDAQSEQAGRRR